MNYITILNCVIIRAGLELKHDMRLGLGAEILDAEIVEHRKKRVGGARHGGLHDFGDKTGVLRPRLVRAACDGPNDVAGRDASALARKLISPAWAAHAFQHAGANKILQHRLKMTRRQIVARGQRFGRDGGGPRMHRDVDDGGDGEKTAARKKIH